MSVQDKTVDKTETVLLDETEYNTLCAAYDKLTCLEACGVDNWSGYPDAMDTLEELQE